MGSPGICFFMTRPGHSLTYLGLKTYMMWKLIKNAGNNSNSNNYRNIISFIVISLNAPNKNSI